MKIKLKLKAIGTEEVISIRKIKIKPMEKELILVYYDERGRIVNTIPLNSVEYIHIEESKDGK